MRPILFEVFGFPVASWYLFYFLANLAGYFVFLRCIKLSQHEQADAIIEGAPLFFVVCYVSGWFGARGLSILVEQLDVTTLGGFIDQLLSIGPMTFYGGALGGFLGGLTLLTIKRWRIGFVADAALPGLVMALGVGRIGCFLNGDDYGQSVDATPPPWWAVKFPNLNDNVYRYPVQLQEAFVSFALAAFFMWWFRRIYAEKRETYPYGLIGSVTVVFSALNRFLNEFYRGDVRGSFLGTNFSTSQGIAVILCFVCLFLGVRIFNSHQKNRFSH